MAGDWIKMRADLHTHPKVVRIASALKADRLRVVGGLHAVWCLFDVHSTDGELDGYNPEALDDLIGWPGFTAAMMAVGWMEQTADSLVTPRFDEHNGQSAKRRAQETERKRLARETSAPNADKKRTREEKRREEVNHHSETTTSTTEPPNTKNPPTSSSSFDDRCKIIADRLTGLEAKRGIEFKFSPNVAKLMEWVRVGVTDPQLREAYELALAQRIKAGDPSPINYGFMDTFIRKVMQDDGVVAVPIPVKEWHETASGIEAKAVELGLTRRFDEPFPAFKDRVSAAAAELEVAAA